MSCAQLTGMPQFVLIPAPVTTTTFFDLPNVSAISCSCRSQPGPTLMVGIFAPYAHNLPESFSFFAYTNKARSGIQIAQIPFLEGYLSLCF